MQVNLKETEEECLVTEEKFKLINSEDIMKRNPRIRAEIDVLCKKANDREKVMLD